MAAHKTSHTSDSGTSAATIALIEDDDDIRNNVINFLRASGFECWGVASAENFYAALMRQRADLFIVDLGLPGEDGLSLIKRLSDQDLPVIAMTARGQTPDRIAGLSAGALQYFVKPVDLIELTAGIRSLLSKLTLSSARPAHLPWRIDSHSSTLFSPDQQAVPLTSRELELLAYLLKTPNRLVPKSELMLMANAAGDDDFHRIESVLRRLRKKTTDITGQVLPVRTVFGKGLSFLV